MDTRKILALTIVAILAAMEVCAQPMNAYDQKRQKNIQPNITRPFGGGSKFPYAQPTQPPTTQQMPEATTVYTPAQLGTTEQGEGALGAGTYVGEGEATTEDQGADTYTQPGGTSTTYPSYLY
jgi:hypothetical protein